MTDEKDPNPFDFGIFNNFVKDLPTGPLFKPIVDLITHSMQGKDFKGDIYFDNGNYSYLANFNLNTNLGYNKAKNIIDAGPEEMTKRSKRFHEVIKQSLLKILDTPSNLPMLINIDLDSIEE